MSSDDGTNAEYRLQVGQADAELDARLSKGARLLTAAEEVAVDRA